MQHRRSRVVGATVALAAIVALGACDSSKTPSDGFTAHYKGEDGQESTVKMNSNAVIPADFPTNEVPLPETGKLQAAVTGKRPPNRYYTFTYGIAGQNGVQIGREYSGRLERAGYKIKNYNESTSTDGGFTSFDAIGKKWDLSVVSGKGSRLERAALSLQVTTHGSLDTADELTDPVGDVTLDPSDPNATTTTTIPLNGG